MKPRRNAPEAQCHGKEGFLTWTLARRAARSVRRRKKAAVAPYRCPHCQRWHIGRVAGAK